MAWFNVDLALGEFSVPERKITTKLKIATLIAKLFKAKQKRVLPAKQLASLINKFTSKSMALGSVTRL